MREDGLLLDTNPVMMLNPKEEYIMFGETVLTALDHPALIRVMLNPEKKVLAIITSAQEDKDALVVISDPDGRCAFSSRTLIRNIRKLTGWADMESVKIAGLHIREAHAVIFDLRNLPTEADDAGDVTITGDTTHAPDGETREV